jgi:hypothetical protein
MTLLETSAPLGRRTIKFTPANIQKIKDLVAQGVCREEIARLIDVTVGSLQVTCSRLGISLRTPPSSNRNGSRWIGAVGRPNIANSPPRVRQRPRSAQFHISIERSGVRQATDLPLTGSDLARLGLEAQLRDLSMTQLLTKVVTTALKKKLVEESLREPSQDPAPQAAPESA